MYAATRIRPSSFVCGLGFALAPQVHRMKPRSSHVGFALFICAFVAYGSLYIYRTSFVIDGTRYFSLQDDAMVSMRYAKNLANGHGLVWNPGGERIQGYTNPLWVAFMALLHVLPIAPATTSLPVQVTALLCLVLTLIIVRRLSMVAGAADGWWPAVIMTATYLPLNNWSLQGSEVAALAPLIAGAALIAIGGLSRGSWRAAPYWLLGAAVLIRLDMAVPFVVLLVAMTRFDEAHRQRHLLVGGALLAATVAMHLAFGFWYFGDPLPNTYYLKMTGFPTLLRITRGAWVMLAFLFTVALGVALMTLALWRNHNRVRQLLAVLVTGQLAYSIYVGGDAWEWWGGSNRYVTVVMPLFFVLAGAGFNEFLAFARSSAAPSRTLRRQVVVCATLAVIILGFNATRGIATLREWVLIDRPIEVDANEQLVRLALRLRETTAPDATIAVAWAGALPYHAERPAIDLLGKTDPVIAHQPMHPGNSGSPYTDFFPGHLKWDYAYSIGRLRPDVVVQLWREPDSALSLLARDYEPFAVPPTTVFVRKASGAVRPGRFVTPGTSRKSSDHELIPTKTS
jgi:hypothetical protein